MNNVSALLGNILGKKPETYQNLDVYRQQAEADALKVPGDAADAAALRQPIPQAGGGRGFFSFAGAKRRFTVEAAKTADGKRVAPGGAYKSADPLAAARKAAGKLFDKAKKTARKIHFKLRETTRGSDKKEHAYVAVKHVLAKPLTIRRGDATVHVHHKFEVRAE